jgi:hypothetical protein
MNIFSMFHEKDDFGKSTRDWSMTRVVVFMFACVFCGTTIRFGFEYITWPVACVMLIDMLALPLIWLFDSLASWLSTPSGKQLIEKALALIPNKVETKIESKVSNAQV